MFEAMTSSPFFGLALTLICWWLAVRFQKKTGQLIFNPVLVTSVLVIAILLIFHIPLAHFFTPLVSRLLHLQTTFFFPFLAQVTLRYSCPHFPQISMPVSA